jgi:hypothetical protein
MYPVYHAHFWPSKTPVVRVLGSKSIPTRFDARSLDHVQTQAPHAQILPSLTISSLALPRTVSTKNQKFESPIRRPQARQHHNGGRVGGVRHDSLCRIPYAPTSADSTNSYAHGAATPLVRRTDIPSAPAPELPSRHGDQGPHRARLPLRLRQRRMFRGSRGASAPRRQRCAPARCDAGTHPFGSRSASSAPLSLHPSSAVCRC